jgi:hypothetical protein
MGEEHHFCANSPIQENGRSTVSLVKESQMLPEEGLGLCSARRIELTFKGILPVSQAFKV